MATKIRQASRSGSCVELGEIINETSRAYIFRRPNGETAFIHKNAPTLHVQPCMMCRDPSTPSSAAPKRLPLTSPR
jgi:hypothetical protein